MLSANDGRKRKSQEKKPETRLRIPLRSTTFIKYKGTTHQEAIVTTEIKIKGISKVQTNCSTLHRL